MSLSAASMGEKITEADKLMKKANKYWQPSLMDFRLKPDWEAAAPLFEKAALLYKVRIGVAQRTAFACTTLAQSAASCAALLVLLLCMHSYWAAALPSASA